MSTCLRESETGFAPQQNGREQTPYAHARMQRELPTRPVSVVLAVLELARVERLEQQLAYASF